jgi:hypothetical protein
MKIAMLMYLCFSGFSLFSYSSFAQATNTPTQVTNAVVLVRNAPLIDGSSFCCDAMVRAVNSLRRLGKNDALEVLRTNLRENGNVAASEQNEKILLICRLLFVNPQGWKQPRLGQPDPDVDRRESEKIPLFPLILSHGTPFLLVRGYEASGYTSDTADKCVELCEKFSLILDDLPEKDYENAARELIRTETFKNLYLTAENRNAAEKMVLAQAHCTDQTVRREKNFKSSIDIKIGN